MRKIISILSGLAVSGVALVGLSTTSSAADEPCVPSPAWTETVVVAPAVPGTPAIPAVTEEQRTGWQRYSYNGPWESNTEAPPFPSDKWQPNVKGDPHGVGVEGAYYRSNGNSGKGDWFYLEGTYETVVVTPEVPATPGTPEVTETVEHPAVECPEEPGVPTDTPTTPTDEPTTPVEPESPVLTPTVAPETPEQETTDEPVEGTDEIEAEDEDPVVQTTTVNEPNRTIKIKTHESGKVTREVTHYDAERTEEGL